MTRKYSSISVQTSLANTINSTQTTIQVPSSNAALGLLGGEVLGAGDIFTIAINPDTINEEVLYIFSSTGNPLSGDTFTVVREQSGTTGQSHSAGSAVRHVLASDDLNFYVENLVPDQTSESGKFLTTNGSAASWGTPTIDTTPTVLLLGGM
jgi:hypothetical protein